MIDIFSKNKKQKAKRTWEIFFHESRDFLYQVIEENDPFKDWDLMKIPDYSLKGEFFKALRVIFGHGEKKLAEQYLKRTLLIAQRFRDENTFEVLKDTPGCAYPMNRGEALRTELFAKAMLGKNIDIEDLQQAARDYLEWCWLDSRSKWTESDEYDALTAVMLYLIAGDKDSAYQALQTIKKSKYYDELFSVLLLVSDKECPTNKQIESLERLLNNISNIIYTQPNGLSGEAAFYPFQIAWIYLQQTCPEKALFSFEEIAGVVRNNQ